MRYEYVRLFGGVDGGTVGNEVARFGEPVDDEMAPHPCDHGELVTKSMAMSCHGRSGIGRLASGSASGATSATGAASGAEAGGISYATTRRSCGTGRGGTLPE